MQGLIYLLCAATATACAGLLLRGFRRTGTRLLLWCSGSFLLLALENAIVFVDLIIVPNVDLFAFRSSIALAGVVLLLVGLIWDTG